MLRSSFRFKKILESLEDKNLAITKRVIPFHGGTLALLFIKQLTDTQLLSEGVIKPLMLYCADGGKAVNANTAADRVLYASDCSIEIDESKIMNHILTGMVVILFSTEEKYLVVNLKKVEHRSVSTPEIEYVMRGPLDSFTENFDVNLSLLRNRIKDENLQIQSFTVGKRTKTTVAVIYLKDVANDTVVKELEKRIEAIDVDGIYESGELQSFLLNKKTNLFPQMGLIERPDMASRLLLDGRAVVMVEGSGLLLYAPVTFNEFFYSCDDFYDNKFFALFVRILRYLALFIAFTATSVFVAVTSFHTDVLPSPYAIMLAEMRIQVPFTSLTGAFLLETLMELIRESLVRVPKQIGSAIGIVGAIVIGQAAISAGIFSALLLILASASLLCSFVIPDYTLMNSFRVLKFLLLLMTGIFGFYGFTLCLCVIAINIVSVNSFGVPYLAPYAPFNLYDFLRSYMNNKTLSPYRTAFLNTKNKTRKSSGKEKGEESGAKN